MVTAEAAMAVVRAARPVFRCAHDGIAFAANAAFLADGYSLGAVGHAALLDPLPADEEEVGIDGWNSMENCYAFLYSKEEEGKKKFILMKCVVIADFLAIDALDLEAQHKEPCNVQINVKDFFSEEQHKNYKDMYKNFASFINILNTTLLVELGHKDTAAAQIPHVENSSSINSSGNVTWENPSTRTTEPAGSEYVMWGSPSTRMTEPSGSENVLWENPSTRTTEPAGSEYVMWGNPSTRMTEPTGLFYPPVVLVGHDDTAPVPGVGFYPNSGGTGGSMHVGPNDPCFFPTNPSTPLDDLGSVPPGGRYDPIGPPDVPEFEPSRFVRHSGGSSHPDLEFFQQGPDFF